MAALESAHAHLDKCALVLSKLKANNAASCVVFPVSSSCIGRFMSEAMGTGSVGDDKENRPADIVILDQHIDFTSSTGIQVRSAPYCFII